MGAGEGKKGEILAGPAELGPMEVPEAGVCPGGGPKIRSFFFLLPPLVSFFLPLLGRFVEFCGVIEGRDPQMCPFGVLGLSCEALAAPKPKRAHIRAPALQTPPKFNGTTPKRRRKNCGGRGKKKRAEILGGPAEGSRGERPNLGRTHKNFSYSNNSFCFFLQWPIL